MKNKLKSLVFLLALGLILSACNKDEPKNTQNEKSVVIKTEEQIQDENLNEDFYDLVNSANKELSEGEKAFIAKLLKYITNRDTDSLSKILADPLKSEVGGDLRVLDKKLSPSSYTGPISSIKKISKKDGEFLIIVKCEDDSLVILAKNEGDKLTSLDLKLGSTMIKNKKLKEDNQAFIDRSYDIIKALRNDDKDSFKKYVKGLGLSDDKFDEMYKGLKEDLNMAGEALTDKAKVKVSFAEDLIKTAPIGQNLVDVTLVYTFENIEKIVYDFIYTEDLDLISIEVSPDEKE